MHLAVLTTGRQDWGILRSTCLALRVRCELTVLAGGMAVSERFGDAATSIAADGFTVQRLEWPVGEAPIEFETSAALRAVGEALRARPFDALVLVGDRFETAAAALAATLLSVPLVHIHGGEETEGAFDNALRHSVTKMAHLHFVSHERYAARLVQMGEHPSSVHIVGAPGLDNLTRDDLPTKSELERLLGLKLDAPVVLVAVHPTTLAEDPAAEARAVASAIDRVPATYVVTLPNADPGGVEVRALLENAGRGPRRVVVQALGDRGFWRLLRLADAMVGNSSSALIEAPAVALPAVNIGDRQAGRLRGGNIIDAPADVEMVAAALRRALTREFREEVRRHATPFGDGTAGRRIAEHLLGWIFERPPRKRFYDLLDVKRESDLAGKDSHSP